MIVNAEQFITKSNAVHKSTYDYSKVVFTNMKTKVIIICKLHGDFLQQPYTHHYGRGCQLCAKIKQTAAFLNSPGRKSLTDSEFISRSNTIHNNLYDYTQVVYKNWKTKVIIGCSIHGTFLQSPSKHIDKDHPTGCPKCANKQQTTEDFVRKSQQTHGDVYDYSKSIYINDTTKLIIVCKEHGDFSQLPSNHHSLAQGCIKCSRIRAQDNIGYYAEPLFRSQPERKLEPAKLYYVKLSSPTESFYKVGLTKKDNVRNRFYGMPYSVDIIKVVEGTLYELWQQEQAIIQGVDHYTPHNKFNGWTECFSTPLQTF
jgi:hypothetical protein